MQVKKGIIMPLKIFFYILCSSDFEAKILCLPQFEVNTLTNVVDTCEHCPKLCTP